jgi:hypothetical protein
MQHAILVIALFTLICLGASCNKNIEEPTQDEPPFVKFEYDLNNLVIEESFGEAQSKGVLEQAQLMPEASGLASSRVHPGLLYTHNDKGNANRLFCIGEDASYRGYFWVWGTANRDWEDICIGPGPQPGLNYIYLGDIGDNDSQYEQIIINRFVEPYPLPQQKGFVSSIPAEQVERIILQYPDGPKDAETLMIDPWTKDLYIVTKREARSSLYRAPYPHSTTSVSLLEKVAEFPFNRALAGDISGDGKQIVIKTDRRLYYWTRESGQSLLEALSKTPRLLPYKVEPQGEAFTWTPDGKGYFTLSEKSGPIEPVLYFYAQK